MWILKGLQKHIPKGVDEKLELVVGGRDFACLDKNSISRNTQFELRIASYFCQGDCSVDLSTKTDVIAFNKKYAFHVECKRIASSKQVENKLSEANKQLINRTPRRMLGRMASGIIAADVTKVGFKHNGLTMGKTNEHSRDVIQQKLVEATKLIKSTDLFDKNNRLDQIWLQIHIPSLIEHPPMSVTRFSSYFFHRRTDRTGVAATKSFTKIFKRCSVNDERSLPSQKLKIRNPLLIPKGTTFNIEEDLVIAYVNGDPIPPQKDDEIIASIEINGKEELFYFAEFESIVEKFGTPKREMQRDLNQARLSLIAEMYLQKHPYEELE